jgi:hypothetical protein
VYLLLTPCPGRDPLERSGMRQAGAFPRAAGIAPASRWSVAPTAVTNEPAWISPTGAAPLGPTTPARIEVVRPILADIVSIY